MSLTVLALLKGPERYVFVYDDGHRDDVLQAFGRFAADAELSFNWQDAAVLSQRVRDSEARGLASEGHAPDWWKTWIERSD